MPAPLHCRRDLHGERLATDVDQPGAPRASSVERRPGGERHLARCRPVWGRLASLTGMEQRLHVFLGTKAQYIKSAPLLRLMDERAVPYRLIDSGQHAKLATSLRTELGVRDPDHVLGGAGDVDSVPQALRWSLGLAARLGSGAWLRREVRARLRPCTAAATAITQG